MYRTIPWLRLAVVMLLGSSVSIADTPDDPHFNLQWGLNNVGQLIGGQPGRFDADVDAPEAWDVHAGSGSIIVAIVGRGVDPHPEFADRLLEGRATVGDLLDTFDTCPLDTHLAGIIAASTNNGIGVAGLNGAAWILPVRVREGCLGTASKAAEGIVWAVDNGAGIVLAALHFSAGSQDLADAVTYASTRDVLVIAPTGRAGDRVVSYPAAYPECLAVSATTWKDTRSSFSNYGPEVDVSAPGENIWSTWIKGDYSYEPSERHAQAAAAHVAGVAALVRSYAPQLSATEVAQVLLDSTDDLGEPGWDEQFGVGRINARRALDLAPAPVVRVEQVEPWPTQIPAWTRSPLTVRVVGVSEQLSPDSVSLMHRSGSGQFTISSMDALGDDLFRAEFLFLPCQTVVEYYISATSVGGNTVTEPLNAPVTVYRAEVVAMGKLFADDFEIDRGWMVEGGVNNSGRWTRGIPVGTSAQPAYDASSGLGRHCTFTGQHSPGYVDGTDDVDGGPNLLVSPVITLSESDAEISYARWFCWSGGGQEDYLTVDVSRDGGVSWAEVEVVTSTKAWVFHRFRLSDFPELSGNRLRVRFSVSDDPNDSLTEAAIDEFEVFAIECTDAPESTLPFFRQMSECWTGPFTPLIHGVCDVADLNADNHVDLVDFSSLQRDFSPD